MEKLDIRRMGIAFGLTGALLYLGCIIVMATVGREGTIKFFNSLFHGVDSSGIISMDTSLCEGGMGLVQTLIIGWLIGACVAGFYNVTLKDK